jgi:hypothetical protein
VLKLITLMFGMPSEVVREQVRLASIERLEVFAERILFATKVEEVLAD